MSVDRYSKPVIIDGDLMEVTSGIIAHQVNCQGVIGAGVSGAIIKKYPVVRDRYIRAFKDPTIDPLFGYVDIIPVTDTLKVANIFSQNNCGNAFVTGLVYTSMYQLINGLKEIREKYPDDVIYVPYKIGCGLGGGSWNDFMKKAKDIPNLIVIRKKEANYE